MIKDLISEMETKYIPKGILKINEGMPNIRPCQLFEIGNFRPTHAVVEFEAISEENRKKKKKSKSRSPKMKKDVPEL